MVINCGKLDYDTIINCLQFFKIYYNCADKFNPLKQSTIDLIQFKCLSSSDPIRSNNRYIWTSSLHNRAATPTRGGWAGDDETNGLRWGTICREMTTLSWGGLLLEAGVSVLVSVSEQIRYKQTCFQLHLELQNKTDSYNRNENLFIYFICAVWLIDSDYIFFTSQSLVSFLFWIKLLLVIFFLPFFLIAFFSLLIN